MAMTYEVEMWEDAGQRAFLGTIRHDWTVEEVLALVRLPLPELIYTAQSIHRRHFDPTLRTLSAPFRARRLSPLRARATRPRSGP